MIWLAVIFPAKYHQALVISNTPRKFHTRKLAMALRDIMAYGLVASHVGSGYDNTLLPAVLISTWVISEPEMVNYDRYPTLHLP